MTNIKDLDEIALEIVYKLRIGEVAHAFYLYQILLNRLLEFLDDDNKKAFAPLFSEMLKAQECSNVVWLADLIEYVLLDSLHSMYTA